MGKTLIVGDVHGCYDELLALLDKAAFDPLADRLFFVGDLINRGPASAKTLELAFNLKAKTVLGNHEVGLLEFLEGKRDSKQLAQTWRQIESLPAGGDFWRGWIESWPKLIEEEDFIVIHAGVVPEYKPKKTPLEIATRVRHWNGRRQDLKKMLGPPWHDLYKGKKPIIYGHWSLQGLTLRENSIGLDTGCVWGGRLSALVWPTRQIIQVQAQRTYFSY